VSSNRPFSLLAVLALVATLALGACSSGGDDDAGATTTTAAENAGEPSETTEAAGGDDEEETTTTEAEDEGDEVEVSADARAYVDAMTDSMTADEDFPLSDEAAECFSARTIDTIGVDRLQAAGVTPEMMSDEESAMDFSDLGLTEDEAGDLYDNFGRCDIDLQELMMQSMAADEEVTPAMQACMETVLTDVNLRKLMVSSMMNGDEAMENDPELEELMGGLMGCAFMGMGEDLGELDGMGEDTTTTAAAG
jgi:hypothetical protein